MRWTRRAPRSPCTQRRRSLSSESLRSVLAGPVAGQPRFVLALRALAAPARGSRAGYGDAWAVVDRATPGAGGMISQAIRYAKTPKMTAPQKIERITQSSRIGVASTPKYSA